MEEILNLINKTFKDKWSKLDYVFSKTGNQYFFACKQLDLVIKGTQDTFYNCFLREATPKLSKYLGVDNLLEFFGVSITDYLPKKEEVKTETEIEKIEKYLTKLGIHSANNNFIGVNNYEFLFQRFPNSEIESETDFIPLLRVYCKSSQ